MPITFVLKKMKISPETKPIQNTRISYIETCTKSRWGDRDLRERGKEGTHNRSHLQKEINTQKSILSHIQQLHHGIVFLGVEFGLGDGEVVYPFVEAEESAGYRLSKPKTRESEPKKWEMKEVSKEQSDQRFGYTMPFLI
jgi:hypothetical protein